MRRTAAIERFGQDLKHALRGFARNPLFTSVENRLPARRAASVDPPFDRETITPWH